MKTKRIIAVLLCFLLLCSLCGCSSKTALTAEAFTTAMEAEGFTVTDITSLINTSDLATSVIIAENESFEIEFYVLTDSETGEDVFYNNKQLFKDEHSVTMMSTELTSGNYNYYAFTADGNFHVIVRVDNTMLWCEADKAYKGEIVDLIKSLGYK